MSQRWSNIETNFQLLNCSLCHITPSEGVLTPSEGILTLPEGILTPSEGVLTPPKGS